MAKIDSTTVEKYQNILAKDPNSQVFAPLADAYLEMGMLQEAESLARSGIKRHPNLAGGFVVLGKIYRAKSDSEQAIECLRKAVALAPTNILAHQTLGEIFFDEREAKEALKCFKMVLFLNPNAERARKIVQKLESVSADEFSDEAFQMTPLKSLQENKSNSESASGSKRNPAYGRQTSNDSAGMELNASATTEANAGSVDKAMQRVLSLVDALIVRNELGKAQFMLQDCFKEFGDHPELLTRSRALLIRANPGLEESEMAEQATEIRPLASRDRQARDRKLEVLHLLLRKIEEVQI